MDRNNTVSAIIPTHKRPELVLRAVRSALGQRYEALEVIVVVDGPDEATTNALGTITDHRLRVIHLPQPQGAQIARNTGIDAARGDWIALLDDDDEWLPKKIDVQMARARASTHRYPIVSCQYINRTTAYELIWPRKQPYEPLSEYLLARNTCSMGEGRLSTITLLFPKELAQSVPFSPTLKRCQEVDWVLHAARLEGCGIEFIVEPLAISHDDATRSRISTVPDWRLSLEWVESVRTIITPRAYSSYVAITVASHAARQRDWRAFFELLKRIVCRGSPKPRDIAFFFSVWCVPRSIQLAIRRAGL